MQRALVVEFTKMNGAGNDFIVIDNRFYHFSDAELQKLAVRYCPRRTGIGADGLLALNASHTADWRMRYVNADGSFGTMCGNGARCLAQFARAAGIPASGERSGVPVSNFVTDAGVYAAHVSPEGWVRLFVPPPRAFRSDVPMAAETPFPTACTIWTGTEHAVVFSDDVARLDLEVYGRPMRYSQALGDAGANVDYVQVTGPSRVKVRTWEKGVEAETLACGTGAVASALVAAHLGLVEGPVVTVVMPGGKLYVGCGGEPLNPTDVHLEGPAESVYRGTIEIMP
ncbi:MAG: diaminopimelate epimerase [Rhodothermales bacterium]